MPARSSAERRIAIPESSQPPAVARPLPRAIRMVLADGDSRARARMKAVLGGLANIRVVGEAADGDEAVRTACARTPDIVLLDIDLPGLDAIAAAGELNKRLPACRAIIVTGHRNGDYRRQLAAAGVRAYLRKDAAPHVLREAIDAVYRGRTMLGDSLTGALLSDSAKSSPREDSHADALTARERQILALIANGEKNRTISKTLRIGLRTVETHRERLMSKLDIRTIAGLTKYALSRGLTRPR